MNYIDFYKELMQRSNSKFFSFNIIANDAMKEEKPLIHVCIDHPFNKERKSKLFKFIGEESFVIAIYEALEYLEKESASSPQKTQTTEVNNDSIKS